MINKFSMWFGIVNLLYGFAFLFLGLAILLEDWTIGVFAIPFGFSVFGIIIGISSIKECKIAENIGKEKKDGK